jgi:hypothetical protein
MKEKRCANSAAIRAVEFPMSVLAGKGREPIQMHGKVISRWPAPLRSVRSAFALALIPILCVGTMQERLSEMENLLHYLL